MAIPVIVLSKSRGLFRKGIWLPLENSSEDYILSEAKTKVAELLADEKILSELRFLIKSISVSYAKTMGAFEWSSDVSELAQKLFLDARKKELETYGKLRTTEEVFHRIIDINRCLSCSKGQINSTKEIYELATKLEETRLERVDKVVKE